MNHKLGMRIAGILSFISGILMYNNGWDYKWGVEIPKSSATLFAAIGCIFFIFSFFLKQKKGIMVCENCNEKYKLEHVQISVCPKCNGKLIYSKKE